MSLDDSAVGAYLNVFRAAFEKTGHSAHYEMMMGDAYVHEPDQNNGDHQQLAEEALVF